MKDGNRIRVFTARYRPDKIGSTAKPSQAISCFVDAQLTDGALHKHGGTFRTATGLKDGLPTHHVIKYGTDYIIVYRVALMPEGLPSINVDVVRKTMAIAPAKAKS
jgi:hypothetical protein